MKAWQIGSIAAALGLVIGLSLWWSGRASCEGLEADYLAAVKATKQTATFGSPASNDELRAEADTIVDDRVKALELAFLDLSDQCGDRAAMVAHGKAIRIVFDK